MKFTPLPALDGHAGVQHALGTDRQHPGDVSIEYALNTDRYRCAQWADLDWREGTWLFGDSFAIGIGVAYQHSIAGYLEATTGYDVINVSQGGSSIRYQVDQLHNMIAQGLRPARVAVIWPDVQRWPWVGEPCAAQPQLQAQMYSAHTADDSYMRARARLDIQDFRNVIELLRVPCAELTWSTETQAAVTHPPSCESWHQWTYCTLDLARDQQHPGPTSHSNAHEEILEQWARFK